MPDTNAAPARVCLLDDGYSREARSLLYNAYRHEPTLPIFSKPSARGMSGACG